MTKHAFIIRGTGQIGRALGHIPVETYANCIRPICDWLIKTQAQGDW